MGVNSRGVNITSLSIMVCFEGFQQLWGSRTFMGVV
jgi:hypothetical protein